MKENKIDSIDVFELVRGYVGIILLSALLILEINYSFRYPSIYFYYFLCIASGSLIITATFFTPEKAKLKRSKEFGIELEKKSFYTPLNAPTRASGSTLRNYLIASGCLVLGVLGLFLPLIPGVVLITYGLHLLFKTRNNEKQKK